ncbi:hypothetical protein [Prescottella equi]|uniref:hypothetical protein n=1 Tax=Rhodococcus hoagii TaxID=43767 RepID=UPI003D964FB4
MVAPKALPSIDELVAELDQLRQRGWRRAHTLHLPALDHAVHLTNLADEVPGKPAAIETLLRRSVERLGGGEFGQAAMLTFGLEVDTRFLSSTKRRQRAAACIEPDGVTPDYFRKTYEKDIFILVAGAIIELCEAAVRGDAAPAGHGNEQPRTIHGDRSLRTGLMALATLGLVLVALSLTLAPRPPSAAEKTEALYDGADPLSGTREDCSGVTRSQPAHPERPTLIGPDGQAVGTLGLLTWPGCDVVWGRVLWRDDPTATYQIPAGWTLHVEIHRPATNTRASFTEPASATPVEWAYGPMLATVRGCVQAEAYFSDGVRDGARTTTVCATP